MIGYIPANLIQRNCNLVGTTTPAKRKNIVENEWTEAKIEGTETLFFKTVHLRQYCAKCEAGGPELISRCECLSHSFPAHLSKALVRQVRCLLPKDIAQQELDARGASLDATLLTPKMVDIFLDEKNEVVFNTPPAVIYAFVDPSGFGKALMTLNAVSRFASCTVVRALFSCVVCSSQRWSRCICASVQMPSESCCADAS